MSKEKISKMRKLLDKPKESKKLKAGFEPSLEFFHYVDLTTNKTDDADYPRFNPKDKLQNALLVVSVGSDAYDLMDGKGKVKINRGDWLYANGANWIQIKNLAVGASGATSQKITSDDDTIIASSEYDAVSATFNTKIKVGSKVALNEFLTLFNGKNVKALKEGSNVKFSYDDKTMELSVNCTGGGSGGAVKQSFTSQDESVKATSNYDDKTQEFRTEVHVNADVVAFKDELVLYKNQPVYSIKQGANVVLEYDADKKELTVNSSGGGGGEGATSVKIISDTITEKQGSDYDDKLNRITIYPEFKEAPQSEFKAHLTASSMRGVSILSTAISYVSKNDVDFILSGFYLGDTAEFVIPVHLNEVKDPETAIDISASLEFANCSGESINLSKNVLTIYGMDPLGNAIEFKELNLSDILVDPSSLSIKKLINTSFKISSYTNLILLKLSGFYGAGSKEDGKVAIVGQIETLWSEA